MSSAQAAASAAFKANNSAHPTTTALKKKPALRLQIDNNVSRVSLAAAQLSHGRAVLPMSTHPAKSPAIRTKRQQSIADNASVVSTTSDYFSMGNGHPTESVPATPRQRIANTAPQEMLDLVRNSIHAKCKTGVAKDANRKSQIAIQEFRQSVDQRRLKLLLSHELAPAPLDEARKSSSSLDLRSGSAVFEPHRSGSSEPPYKASNNNSRSSLGLSFSDSYSNPATPSIRLSASESFDDQKRKPSSESASGITTPVISSQSNFGSLQCPNPNHASPNKLSVPSTLVSPIQVPPSPNALARGVASSIENMSHLSLLPEVASTPDSESRRARRKPPPELLDEKKDPADQVSSFSERSLIDLTASDKEDEEVRFPQYPELTGSKHGKRRHFFHKHKNKKDKGMYDPNLDNLDPREEQVQAFVHSRSVTPVVQQHPVKFKTTMRKESKRRDKKAFNEDKPWKNQSDLEHVSDLQKKRYEGLWVSNKGLYMDRVVTRLVGVDYDNTNIKPIEVEEKKWLSEKEVSEQAAKLSSQAKVHVHHGELDLLELHGLRAVEKQQLIHGLVVKRIWLRSKLPDETLAAVWDLVDFRHDGTLNKAEFIVGMWLVDQCLYGRKLPRKVPELVWTSLGNIGVNVVIKKKRR